jgi:hypothetical protein
MWGAHGKNYSFCQIWVAKRIKGLQTQGSHRPQFAMNLPVRASFEAYLVLRNIERRLCIANVTKAEH